VQARRSPLFSDFTCDECVEYELELGFDRLGGTRAVSGEVGRLAHLSRLAQELEGMALGGGSHETYATGVAALERFLVDEMGVSDTARMWREMKVNGAAGRAAEAERGEKVAKFWRVLHLFVASSLGRWKYNTVVSYVDGGRAAKFRDLGVGVGDCPTKFWRVRRLLRGLKRRLGDEGELVKQAEAMDAELLGLMAEDLMAGRTSNVRGDGVMGEFERRQATIVLFCWSGRDGEAE
jgi:hypothetical protein